MAKRILFFAAVALTLFACGSNDFNELIAPSSSSSDDIPSSSSDGTPPPPPPPPLTFDDIQYRVGEGENRAMLIVQWNDGKSPDAWAWGYRWSGTKYGYDMISDIAKADGRLFYLVFDSGYLGNAIGGIGFDASGSSNNIQLSNGGACKSPIDGSIDTDAYDFDYWKLCDDANAHWQAGWYEAYWSYWVSNSIDSKWEYSGLGASSRVLENNSVDAWFFDLDLNDPELSTYHRCMAADNCNGRDFFGTIIPVSEVEP